MTRYQYCMHCCKRFPAKENHTCRPPALAGNICPKCGVEMYLHPGIHDGNTHCSAPPPPEVAQNAGEENLHELRKGVTPEVIASAQAWARKQADTWPHGTYSPNDFPPFFEKGYLKGRAAAFSSLRERLEKVEADLDTITKMPWFSFGAGRYIQDEAASIAGQALATLQAILAQVKGG